MYLIKSSEKVANYNVVYIEMQYDLLIIVIDRMNFREPCSQNLIWILPTNI